MKAEFPISEKIYAALLHAFPKSHREKYGAAMTQLFRDQCRDEWAEGGNFGLLKLWLNALPDLAGSSIMERLAALKERKTMNDNLANLSAFQTYSPGKTFVRVFVPVFLLVVVASTAVTFLLPTLYASKAIIKVEPDKLSASEIQAMNSYESGHGSDFEFAPNTFEVLKSQRVLTNVIGAMDLNDVWGKKYNGGTVLKTTETMEILKQRMALAPVTNTHLYSITIYSEDKNEAAKIANRIAAVYQEYREQRCKQIQADQLKVLETQLATQSNQTQTARAAFIAEVMSRGRLTHQINISKMNGTGDTKALEDQLAIVSNRIAAATSPSVMADANQKFMLTKIKMNQLTALLSVKGDGGVQITDNAEPAMAPIRPNRPLNITLGILGGIIVASIIGLLVLMAKGIARRRTGAAA